MDQDSPMSSSGFGATTASERASDVCPTCGQNSRHTGLEEFLGKLGISEEMIRNLKSSMNNADVEEYLNVARDYLRNGSNKAVSYAKENPGKVAAGVAVLAIGTGMLVNALRD